MKCYPGSSFFTIEGKGEFHNNQNINYLNSLFFLLNIFRFLNEKDVLSHSKPLTENDIDRFKSNLKDLNPEEFQLFKTDLFSFIKMDKDYPIDFLNKSRNILKGYFFGSDGTLIPIETTPKPIIARKTQIALNRLYKKSTLLRDMYIFLVIITFVLLGIYLIYSLFSANYQLNWYIFASWVLFLILLIIVVIFLHNNN